MQNIKLWFLAADVKISNIWGVIHNFSLFQLQWLSMNLVSIITYCFYGTDVRSHDVIDTDHSGAIWVRDHISIVTPGHYTPLRVQVTWNRPFGKRTVKVIFHRPGLEIHTSHTKLREQFNNVKLITSWHIYLGEEVTIWNKLGRFP